MADRLGGILDALQFAAHKHRDQRRKDLEASPYINHPIALANVLWREGGVTQPDIISAALLHDTIEDTDTTPEELRERFGKKVTDMVLEVTDDKSLDKAQAPADTPRADAHARRQAGEARRQDLQLARHGGLAAADLAAQPPARVFRLGEESGRWVAGGSSQAGKDFR
jgi:guanosine-3',5'-bis(diphosphate) 3'-pyrophosphohydrolase